MNTWYTFGTCSAFIAYDHDTCVTIACYHWLSLGFCGAREPLFSLFSQKHIVTNTVNNSSIIIPYG